MIHCHLVLVSLAMFELVPCSCQKEFIILIPWPGSPVFLSIPKRIPFILPVLTWILCIAVEGNEWSEKWAFDLRLVY